MTYIHDRPRLADDTAMQQISTLSVSITCHVLYSLNRWTAWIGASTPGQPAAATLVRIDRYNAYQTEPLIRRAASTNIGKTRTVGISVIKKSLWWKRTEGVPPPCDVAICMRLVKQALDRGAFVTKATHIAMQYEHST
jgi:hypothetical protein